MTTGVQDPLVGRLVDERYEVLSRIAAGGMATVYLATDTRLERRVALKVMHPHLAADRVFVERFAREARSAARLSHPGVVGVYDQGAEGSVVYLAMEHVPGRTLRDVLTERGALPPREALDVLDALLDALASAHAADVVHRDIKPENILVGRDGRVRVADFGLARAASASTTAASVLIGTVAYLAPELVTEGRADARADVYAAGVVLFELLTGTLPFAGAVPAQVAFAHVASDVPPPSARQPHLPREVDDLVLAATERDVDARPRDAGALLVRLRAVRDQLDAGALDHRPDATPSTTDGRTVVVERHEHVLALPIGEALEAEVHRRLPRAPDRAAAEDPGTGDTGVLVTGLHDARDLDAGTAGDTGGDTGGGTGGGTGGHGSGPDDRARPGATAAGRPAPGSRVRRRRVLLGVLVALLLVAGGLVWAVAAGPLERVTVPNVVTASLDEAQTTLASRELDARVEEVFDETAPAGEVLSSAPAAGARARPGSDVVLTVSKGPELFAVPDLTGDTREAAEAAITERGLVVGTVAEAYSEDVPSGSVVSQQTAAGDQLRGGSPVDLTVSLGREPIDAPALANRTQQDAEQAITDLGLSVGAVTQEASESVPAGSVVRSSPATGTLFRGDAVALVVSSGPPLVTVPDVVSQQVDAARATLQGLGFQVQEEQILGGFFGTVRSQSIAAGQQVPKGSTITLSIV